MVANLKSLLTPISAPPAAFDSGSFFKNLTGDITDALQSRQAGNLVSNAVQNAAQNAGQTIPASGVQAQLANANPAPSVIPVQRGQAQGSTFQPFIDTVKAGGLTNPYGLAAVAATGRSESGWSPSQAAGTWADPSQSGQAGTSGGVLSWRGPRLASLQAYAQSKGESGNGSPQTQAEFFLQENPQVTQALQNAKSPQDAANIMANAWKFAGYNQQGGEAARRQALTQNYYAQNFANQQPSQVADASNQLGDYTPYAPKTDAQRAQDQAQLGDNTPRANVQPQAPAFDSSRFASGQETQGAAGLLSGLQNGNAPTQPYVDPQVTTAFQQPQQSSAAPTVGNNPPAQAPVVQQSQSQSNAPQQIAGAVTPLSRQNVDSETLRKLVQNPLTRQLGLGIAQQVLGGGKTEPWQFVTLPNGTLARANQQTGEVQSLGNFQNNKKELQKVGNALYDASSGQWITPPAGTTGVGKFGLSPIYGTDANGSTVLGQVDENGNFHQVDTGNFKPVGNVSNTSIGTAIVTRDKAGNVISYTPIDNAGKSAADAQGKNIAAAQAALPGVVGNAQTAINSINSLIEDPYLPKMVGAVPGTFGMLSRAEIPNRTPDAARVQSKMNQVSNQAFLAAYDQLRAAGAITDIEGEKGTNAVNRMNAAQNLEDYKAAAADAKQVLQLGVNRARQKAQGNFDAPALNDTVPAQGTRAPTQSGPTATGPNGEKIQWNGSAWVPMSAPRPVNPNET